MTREERLEEEYARQGLMVDFDVCDFINKIYDDFESRTCENCVYWAKSIHMCDNKESFAYKFKATVVKDDGCNNFEKAEK